MIKSLEIDSLVMLDLMTSISKQINVDFTSDGDDHCIDMPKSFGKGYIRGLQFSHGVALLESNLNLVKRFVLNFTKQETNGLFFIFNLEDNISHQFSNSNDKNIISKLQHVMFANDLKDVHRIIIDKDITTTFLILMINRKVFEKKMSSVAQHLSPELELIFKDVNGINKIYFKDYFSLEVSQLIGEFRNCDLEDFMEPMFLEGKCYEILTVQLQNYSNRKNDKHKTRLRKSTVNKIENAIEIIKDELDVKINVHDLAKRVGLNQNTLQSGFKNLFKSSVNDYIKKYRIEHAKLLIETTKLNITEITYKIGINSRSYFTKLFKKRYGTTPSAYLKRSRSSKDKIA
ncbi:helix-turn-helix domain-containing protein [Psychroserpens sp.]|uniref:helix-turn-helix domain-containing protein n=1 Tax=Psychroserpens sp. TaxID=2020870 RepID=UPI003C764109